MQISLKKTKKLIFRINKKRKNITSTDIYKDNILKKF